MGLILPGGENLLDFLQFLQVLLSYDGDLRDPLWWLSGNASPHASCSGASRVSSPFHEDLVWSRGQKLKIPLQC